MAGPSAVSAQDLITDSSVFQNCVDAFKRNVPPQVVHQFQHITSLKDLDAAIKDIERQQAASKSLRNLRKIEPFLRTLNEYAPVIETFVNAKPDILALIWGPIKFCLQIACKYSKAFDSLLSAYRKIQDALPSISVIEKLFGPHKNVMVVLQRVYTDILAFHQRAVLFFSKPGWKMVLQSTCRTLDDSFGDILENLQSSKQLLYNSADIASYLDAHEARTRVEQAFSDQRIKEQKMRKVAIQTWLNAYSHKTQHLELQSLREKYPDTCEWLFNHRSWTSWMTGGSADGQAFWISGIPGAGKTVLFSAMVDRVHKSSSGSADHCTTVYLYCKYNDNARDNFVALARSLINSLLEGNELCYDYLYDIAVNSNEQFATTIDLLSNTVISLLQFYDNTYIGIDGLDEMEPKERAMMTKLILQIMSLGDKDHLAHIFLTSRAEIDMEKSFEGVDRLKLEASHVTGDIRRYAAARTHELDDFQVDQPVLDGLVVATVKRSAGMFLLAKLIFDMFVLCVNKEDFEYELHNRDLPIGIEDAYRRILLRIQKRDQLTRHPRAARLLEILTFTHRTLYLHEVQAALSIDLNRGDINVGSRRYTQHFKEICGSIVEVNSDQTVVLVHTTAKQYLAQCHHEIFNIAEAKERFADICIAYLSMEIFSPDSSQAALELAVLDGSFGFYRYAFCNWLLHMSQAAESRKISQEDFWSVRDVQKVLRNGVPISLDFESLDPDTLASDDIQALVRMKLFSLLATLKEIAKENAPADVDLEFLRPALDHANKIQDLIERLISKKFVDQAEVFLTTAYGNNPYLCTRLGCPRFYQGFSSAAERNTHAKSHLRPYKCSFSNCDFRNTGFTTKAALNNHIHLFHVEDLSLKFSQLDPRSLEERIAEAVRRNDFEALELLCPQITNTKFSNARLRFSIALAIEISTTEAACVLVKHCKSPRTLCVALNGMHRGLTLLTLAAREQNFTVVQALLDRYDEDERNYAISNRDMELYGVFQQCIRYGSLDGFKILLNHKSCRHRLTLYNHQTEIPISPDFSAIWRLLVDSEIQVVPSQTAVRNAVTGNYIESIKMLLDAGMMLNFAPKDDCSLLCCSVRTGNVDMMQLLLDHGADINVCSLHQSTPLHEAVKWWNTDSIEFLVRNKADLTIKDNTGNTAFNTKIRQWDLPPLSRVVTCMTGPELISRIRQFISMGAHVSLPRVSFSTRPAIHELAHNPGTDLDILAGALRLLIANGADIDEMDFTGRTARESLTKHKPEVLKYAGYSLWSSDANEMKLQPMGVMAQYEQATKPLDNQAEDSNSSVYSSEGSFQFYMPHNSYMGYNETRCDRDDLMKLEFSHQPESPVSQTDQTIRSYDWTLDELSANPWAQEDGEAPREEANESASQPYQYTLMQDWF